MRRIVCDLAASTAVSAAMWTGSLVMVELCVASVAMTICAQEPTLADKASARDLFNEGMKLRGHGDAKGALAKFKAAYALWPSPPTGLELGRTHMQLGELIEASERFIEASKLPAKSTETATSENARDEAKKLAVDLAARIPTITIRVTGVPDGTSPSIAIDGREIPVEALTTPRKVNPGPHEIVGRRTGGGDVHQSVSMKEGETREIEIAFAGSDATTAVVTAPMTAAAPVPSEPDKSSERVMPASHGTGTPEKDVPASSGSSLKTMGVIAVVGGGLGLGVGAILGLSARSSYSDAKDAHCGNGRCDTEGKQLTDDARTRGNFATIMFSVGAVFAVSGAVLWLSAPSGHAKPAVTSVGIGPGGVSFAGRF